MISLMYYISCIRGYFSRRKTADSTRDFKRVVLGDIIKAHDADNADPKGNNPVLLSMQEMLHFSEVASFCPNDKQYKVWWKTYRCVIMLVAALGFVTGVSLHFVISDSYVDSIVTMIHDMFTGSMSLASILQ